MSEQSEMKISCILNNESYSDIKQIRELLMKLKSLGKDTIVIEDDLVIDKDIITILSYIKYANLKVKLKIYKTPIKDEILKFIDIVELRLDAIDPTILKKSTGRDDLFIQNIKNYNYIRNNNTNIKIEICTYLNKLNLIDIINLGTTIENMDIDRWNIFRGKDDTKYQISEVEFNKMINCLKELNISSKIDLEKSETSLLRVNKPLIKNNCMMLSAWL